MKRRLISLGVLILAPLFALAPAPLARGESKAGATAVIPVFRLDGPITESPPDEMAAIFGGEKGISLKDLVSHLRKAGKDPNVKAVVILPEGGGPGLAQAEELRQAIQQ